MNDVRFVWMMSYLEGKDHKDGYTLEVCDVEGNVLEVLPKEPSSCRAQKARKAWAKAHPEFVSIAMPKGGRL